MKLKVCLIVAFMWMAVDALQAQEAIKVNQLEMGKVYSKRQIYKALGRPTKVEAVTNEVYEGTVKTYFYGENSFSFVDGEFHGFKFKNPAFAVNGLLKVGDRLGVVNKLGGIKVQGESTPTKGYIYWKPSEIGVYAMIYFAIIYDLNDQVVTDIVCCIHDL
ncbi:MAG: hypothetical protein RR397_01695 [Odoribacter sp.]